jgi:hypothetical protein
MRERRRTPLRSPLINLLFCFRRLNNMPDLNSRGRDGEIVGLFSPTHGRSCERHQVCGRQVAVGSIVKIKREVLMVDEDLGVEGEENAPVRLVPETVLKAVLIADGQESCHVGFLPRHIALCPMEVERLSGKFAQVLELYDDVDDSKHKRTKSVRNQGMASFILMENIQELE